MTDFPLCSISNLGSSPFGRFSKQNRTKEPLSLAVGLVCNTCQYLMHLARLIATKLGGNLIWGTVPSIHALIFSVPLSLSYCKGSSSRRSPTTFSMSTSISSLWYRAYRGPQIAESYWQQAQFSQQEQCIQLQLWPIINTISYLFHCIPLTCSQAELVRIV